MAVSLKQNVFHSLVLSTLRVSGAIVREVYVSVCAFLLLLLLHSSFLCTLLVVQIY